MLTITLNLFCIIWIFIYSDEFLKDGTHMEHLHIYVNHRICFTSSEENKFGHLGINMASLSDLNLTFKDVIWRK